MPGRDSSVRPLLPSLQPYQLVLHTGELAHSVTGRGLSGFVLQETVSIPSICNHSPKGHHDIKVVFAYSSK